MVIGVALESHENDKPLMKILLSKVGLKFWLISRTEQCGFIIANKGAYVLVTIIKRHVLLIVENYLQTYSDTSVRSLLKQFWDSFLIFSSSYDLLDIV